MKTPVSALARIYNNSPETVPTPAEAREFKKWLLNQWAALRIPVVFTTAEITLLEAKTRYIKSGELVVSAANNDSHPLLTSHENLTFRAVHDWHHILAGSDSSLQGEILAYCVARDSAPRDIWWILCSEIVLQAAACLHFGDYQRQKLVRL